MRIATYNIRVTKPEDIKKGRAFILRLPKILRNIKRADADVIAFQEVQRLHITCLKLFLRGYKIYWAKWDFDGGTAIAVKKNTYDIGFKTISVASGREAATLLIRYKRKWYFFTSLHLSLTNYKLDDVKDIIESTNIKPNMLIGDFNILANDDNHEVFKYLKEKGYRKLNNDKVGYHGYGEAEPTAPDNFFTNFGELEDLQVIEDFKASDHNLMYVNLKI